MSVDEGAQSQAVLPTEPREEEEEKERRDHMNGQIPERKVGRFMGQKGG